MNRDLKVFLALLSTAAISTACNVQEWVESGTQQESFIEAGESSGGASSEEESETVSIEPAVDGVLAAVTPDMDFDTTRTVSLLVVPLDDEGFVTLDGEFEVSAEISSHPDSTADLDSLSVLDPLIRSKTVTALSFDSSGSMEYTDPDEIRKEAGKLFIDYMYEEDKVAVFDFGAGKNGDFDFTRTLSDFTSNALDLKAAIDQVTYYSYTPMYRSTLELLESMQLTYPDHDGAASVLILADGMPNGGGNANSVCELATETGIRIDTIGFGTAADLSESRSRRAVEALRELSSCSGGSYIGAADADELNERFENMALATFSGAIRATLVLDDSFDGGDIVEGSFTFSNSEEVDPISVGFRFAVPY